jgi:hypothetical protein
MLGDEYRSLYERYLRESSLAEDGILDQQGINQLLAEHQGGTSDHANRLWLLVNSEAWYRMFIKNIPASSLGDTQ